MVVFLHIKQYVKSLTWFFTSLALEPRHWHNDMPGLTSDATIIAYSEGCPRQIIAYSDRVFGFQCHLELNTEVVSLLVAQEDFSLSTQHRFVETPEQLLSHNYDEMNDKLYTFLDKLAANYTNTLAQ